MLLPVLSPQEELLREVRPMLGEGQAGGRTGQKLSLARPHPRCLLSPVHPPCAQFGSSWVWTHQFPPQWVNLGRLLETESPSAPFALQAAGVLLRDTAHMLLVLLSVSL